MKKRLLTGMCAVVALFAMLGTAHAAVWYVSPDGSDSNTGQSWNQAFATIQQAVSTASDGDEIWVKEGVYVISNTITIAGKNVSIYGGFSGTETSKEQRNWEQHKTIVDGDSKCLVFFISGSGYAILDGFTIRNGVGQDGGGVCFGNTSGGIIRHCVIENNTALTGGGGISIVSANVEIVDSWIHGNISLGKGGGGIYVESGGVNFKMINSIVWGNSAVPYSGPGKGGGIYFNVNSSSNPIVTNSVIFHNVASDGGGIFNNNDLLPVITNTIIYNNTNSSGQPQQIAYKQNHSPIVTYSDVQGGYPGEGNIDEDPLFVDADNGDFHLTSNSPCIDKGTNSAQALPSEDFEGDNRVMDGNGDGVAIVDMGADEYNREVVYSVPLFTSWGVFLLMFLLGLFVLSRLPIKNAGAV